MKLDKRIVKGRKYLDIFDTKEAQKYIGQKCFFSDKIARFSDLDDPKLVKATLTHVKADDCEYCYGSNEIGLADWYYARYILPLAWVKEPEKKLRPYTGIEFAEKFGIWVGHVIRIRDRPENAGQEYEYKIMFVGYRWYKGMFEVFINGCWIDLLTLFELYEYMEDGEWHKFGVEE